MFESLFSTFAESGSFFIANLKLFEKALLGLDDSYIELFTVLALGLLAVLPILVPLKKRQIWRHVVQIIGILVFVFIVYTCMGVFGMIANFFRGFYEIGRENIIALYFLSVPVTILVTSILFGPFFCGWICPTGSSQEFIGMLTRRWQERRRQEGYPFSWVLFVGTVLIALMFFVWLYYLSTHRIFFIEDATVYWTFILIVILFLLVWKMKQWDGSLRLLKVISFFIIMLAAILHIRITSPVHFGFAKVVDPASVLATVIVVIAALLVPRIWCRYLCPWRLAINWTFKHSVKKIAFNKESCTQCGACNRVCEVSAIQYGVINTTECNFCLRCVDHCPENGLRLVSNWQCEKKPPCSKGTSCHES